MSEPIHQLFVFVLKSEHMLIHKYVFFPAKTGFHLKQKHCKAPLVSVWGGVQGGPEFSRFKLESLFAPFSDSLFFCPFLF